MQVAADLVGTSGRVVGVDVATIEPLPAPQVTILQGDVTDPACVERVVEALGRKADVVLSDLAPKLTGIGPRDAAQSELLAGATQTFAKAILRPGGVLVTKTLGGREGEQARAGLREVFETVRQLGLDATRKGSSELYLVASGFKANID